MMRYLKLYLVSLVAFLAIDMLWLGLVARSFYQQQLGFIMAPASIGLRQPFSIYSLSWESCSLWSFPG